MITIVDYGLGNVRAFANVYKRLNIDTQLASTPLELKRASKLILPGVGAFDHAMAKLNTSGLRDTLDDLVLNKGVPVLGVCVGMQMMADSSEEGVSSGLSWISGTVEKIENTVGDSLPLPHMGWNSLIQTSESPILSNLDDTKRFYFLHSYRFRCNIISDVLANACYGTEFPCVINHKNVFGIQCHPEKSHHNGVTLLRNFAEYR